MTRGMVHEGTLWLEDLLIAAGLSAGGTILKSDLNKAIELKRCFAWRTQRAPHFDLSVIGEAHIA
jgi:hypothetical protein